MSRLLQNLGLSLVWGGLFAVAGARICAADPHPANPANPTNPAKSANSGNLQKRGEYIARAADCMSCHTGEADKPFAGGNPLKSAFGTLYGTNITSDTKTGIGSWTEADFERALRLGIRKDGAYLYPAMPYDAYTKMTDADMHALWVYIHGLPAINKANIDNTLPFPLSVREGMAVWQSLYFKPGRFTPVASKDATWNRGAYLVEALEHCSDCHTPRNLAQGPESEHLLGGAQIEGWYAPDISHDPQSKIANWSTDALAKFLKTGVAPDNAKVVGPMQEAVQDSLQYLTDADLHAMAVYLKDQANNNTPETPSKSSLPRLAAGKRLYEDNCSSCHQSNGMGRKGTIPALAGNDSVTASEPYNVIMAMLEGFQPQGTWGAMGSFADRLNDDQISAIANYVRTAWGNDAPPNATPWSVGNWRKNATAAAGNTHALLCPNLAQGVIQPALSASPEALKQAAKDQGRMATLVANYRTARPGTSNAEVIEALSTAYCRAVSSDKISEARMSADIAGFAQHIAVVLAGSSNSAAGADHGAKTSSLMAPVAAPR
jgi:mono/diheme cytochrome c family protein